MAARYADEFNLSSSGPDHAREVFAAADAACVDAGRDPSTLAHSTMAGVLIGRDEAEMGQRLSTLVGMVGSGADEQEWLDERLERWITGTPQEAREQVRQFEAAGVERLMLQDLLPLDLDMIDLMGDALVGQL
jgi:alkanesulfonate monooxygenase SsuD/methylene tetrahydromethanopterin reductase-like flavin-dependent oxidoreductase (luciferase family)